MADFELPSLDDLDVTAERNLQAKPAIQPSKIRAKSPVRAQVPTQASTSAGTLGTLLTVREGLAKTQPVNPKANFQKRLPPVQLKNVPLPPPVGSAVPALAPVPSTFQVTAPVATTIMTPRPLPAVTVVETKAVAPQRSTEGALDILNTIDVNKLNAGRATKNNETYSVDELRELLKALGYPASGKKADLVGRLTNVMKQAGRM